jgi:hypothetical protein
MPMTTARPELIFLSGPQAGQRAVIMSDVALAGRARGAEVILKETACSREQMRFEAAVDGWTVENLSANGTWVNTRRYKQGQIVLLETGDVISAGEVTEMLFVAPGDDPEEALRAAGRQPAAQDEPQPQAGDEARPPADGDGAPGSGERGQGGSEGPADGSQGAATAAIPDQAQAETDPEASARRKRTIYWALGIVYVLGMVVLGVVLMGYGGDDEAGSGADGPEVLSAGRIAESISEPLVTGVQRDTALARKYLVEARTKYRNRSTTGNLCRAVKFFDLHLAYSGEPFQDVEDATLYRRATEELIERVQDEYRLGIFDKRAGALDVASGRFERLHAMLMPLRADPHPRPDHPLLRNINAHLNEIKKELRRRGD